MNYECHDGVTYTIKSGDTLYEVSRKYQVPLSMLLRANPYIDVFNMQPGDTICVPVSKTQSPEKSEIPEMPEMPEVSEMPRMQMENPVAERIVEPKKPESILARDTGEMEWERYVVKSGDTLKTLTNPENLMAFVDKNSLDSIYLLPGIAYQVKK